MGKGSKQRPLKIPREKFEENWEKAFGKKPKKHLHKDWHDHVNEEVYYEMEEALRKDA